MEIKIKETFTGKTVMLLPALHLYGVRDFMGQKLSGLCIQLSGRCEGEEHYEPYQTLTVSFGEYIGIKDCAYVDTNNCPFADQLLEYGFAEDTGLTKSSGYCEYPLWHFEEDFLRSLNEGLYEKYSDEYDKYMEEACG